MIRRHDEQILNRLEALYANGVTQFTRDELLMWYGLTKITKTIFADLFDRWSRILEDYMGEKEAIQAINDSKETISVIVKGDKYLLIRDFLCNDICEMP